ncbi:hypothetical protein [Cupriavidus necator]|uniref:hypothetical protein n=1 Tax=Cupriavidus necator TaxID=106590 RepID=UPI002780F5CE|nr:hypothetical protein [Cupriavidus necator]MDQ0140957.1 hypothetical protein [Cupriavidus necator]
MNSEETVPLDFPRKAVLGVVPGVQSKFAARLIDGKYVVGLTDQEARERYLVCKDLAEQLVAYCRRKATERTDWTHAQILERVRNSAVQKAGEWKISPVEIEWVLVRMQAGLGWS